MSSAPHAPSPLEELVCNTPGARDDGPFSTVTVSSDSPLPSESPLSPGSSQHLNITFLRWVNFQLSKRKESIEDLKTGLCSGVKLCTLIEVLAKRALPARPNKLAKSQIVHLDNLRIAFSFLEEQKGLHLINIQPGAIEAGNLKIILGLIWSLIHKYQILDVAHARAKSTAIAAAAAAAQALTVTEGDASSTPATLAAAPAPSTAESSAKNELLKWVNAQVAPFGVGSASDFSASWQSGRILCALVESMAEPAAPTDLSGLLASNDALEITEAAQKKAEAEYSIPALMDAGDIVNRPSDKALMTYIALFREIHSERSHAANLAVIEADSAAVRAASFLALPLSPMGFRSGSEGDSDEEKHDMEKIVVPLSPMRIVVAKPEEVANLPGAIDDEAESRDTVVVEAEAAATVAPPSSHSRAPSFAMAPFSVEEHKQSSMELSAAELATIPQRTRADTHPALVGAYIDSESLEEAVSPRSIPAYTELAPAEDKPLAAAAPAPVEPVVVAPVAEEPVVAVAIAVAPVADESASAPLVVITVDAPVEEVAPVKKPEELKVPETPVAVEASPAPAPAPLASPYDSEAQSKKDAALAPMGISAVTIALPETPAPAAASSSPLVVENLPEEPKPDPHAVENYAEEKDAEDAEGKLKGETVQQARDRKIEKLMNAIEICVVTPDHKYLQSDVNGVVRAHEQNGASATWTIVDGAGGWKFLRDYQSRYLASEIDGRLHMCKKKPECRFRIHRGVTQYFEDSHGNFMSVLPGGVVRSELAQSEASQWRVCFPVIEGVLQKKGTSGLHRWQERYFAFNGNVMSYWRQQKAVGKERPNGLYHPDRMSSVNINKSVAKRFNIVFQDGKIVELLAPTVEEAVRWVRGLNSRGIKTVQQTRRMSVMGDIALTTPLTRPKSASVAMPSSAASSPARK